MYVMRAFNLHKKLFLLCSFTSPLLDPNVWYFLGIFGKAFVLWYILDSVSVTNTYKT